MLNVVTALPSEARPIIEHLSLDPIETHQVPHIYGKENIQLAISGIGQAKSKLAVKRLAGIARQQTATGSNAWVNIGIAGHQNAALGNCFIVDKIIEERSGAIVYPSIPYRTQLSSANLRTVTQPDNEYRHNALYDMEAYSFFLTAQRHSTLELIVLLKIVSDNKHHAVRHINKTAIYKLISNALPQLDETINQLQHLMTQNFDAFPEPDIRWQDLWHTTYAQQQILSDICRRLRLLDETFEASLLVAKCKTAQEAINVLDKKIASTQLRLEPGS